MSKYQIVIERKRPSALSLLSLGKSTSGNQCKMKGPTLKKTWRCGLTGVWLHCRDTALTAAAQRAGGPQEASWLTSVFCLDNLLGKSFGHHLLPKRGGKEGGGEKKKIAPTATKKKGGRKPRCIALCEVCLRPRARPPPQRSSNTASSFSFPNEGRRPCWTSLYNFLGTK